jgi:hypothetical protein
MLLRMRSKRVKEIEKSVVPAIEFVRTMTAWPNG